MKQSKIVFVKFTNSWLNPKTNQSIFYHEVQLENGDVGTCGTITQLPPKLSVGSVVQYEMDGSKMKIHTSTGVQSELPMSGYASPKPANGGYNKAKKYSKPYNSGVAKSGGRSFSQEEFLGYAWSYAKDLIVAGKKAKDLEELNKMATYIYERIGVMLNGESQAPEDDSISDINELGKANSSNDDQPF